MIPVRWPPPPPVVWCDVAWHGVVVASPSVWSGAGSAWGGYPRPPKCWGSGFLAVVPHCVFGSALGVWYSHPYGDNDDDDGDDDHHQHH